MNEDSKNDQGDDSLVRAKRNTVSQNGEVAIFSKFKPDTTALKNGTSKNTTDLTEAQLNRLPFIKSAKLIHYSSPNKDYFIVQMVVLGTGILNIICIFYMIFT